MYEIIVYFAETQNISMYVCKNCPNSFKLVQNHPDCLILFKLIQTHVNYSSVSNKGIHTVH